MRSIVCLGLVFCVSAIVLADATFRGAVVTKVDGDKVTLKIGTFDKETKKFTYGDPITLTTVKDVKVTKQGKFDKETKKFAEGEAIEGGLKGGPFKEIGEKGVNVTITTDDEEGTKAPKGKIKAITIGGKGFGGKTTPK